MQIMKVLILLFCFATASQLCAQGSQMKYDNSRLYVSIPGGLIEIDKQDGEGAGPPILILRKYDCTLKEIAYNSIELTELIGNAILLDGTYNDFNQGVLQVKVTNKSLGGDYLFISVDNNLQELHRFFYTKAEAKDAIQDGEPRPNVLPIRGGISCTHFRIKYSGEDMYTENGKLHLYYEGSVTSVHRYRVDKNKCTTLWKCKLPELKSIVDYKMKVWGNQLFLLTNSLSKEANGSSIVISCIDYTTGILTWQASPEKTNNMCYSTPEWLYDTTANKLVIAGMATARKITQKEENALCRLYTGIIDDAGAIVLKWTDMPVPAVEGLSEKKAGRPCWFPRAIVRRPDGSYLAGGLLGFILNSAPGMYSQSPFFSQACDYSLASTYRDNNEYLDGHSWIGGSLVLAFSEGDVKMETVLFPVIDKPFRNYTTFAPYYWDARNDKLYMCLLNSNEKNGATPANFTVGYYLLTVSAGKSELSLVEKQDCHDIGSGPVVMGTMAFLAVSPEACLFGPWTNKNLNLDIIRSMPLK